MSIIVDKFREMVRGASKKDRAALQAAFVEEFSKPVSAKKGKPVKTIKEGYAALGVKPPAAKKTTRKPAAAPLGQITVILGPYGTEVQARQEALQYLHPQVFLYRSAIFPNPQNYKVRVIVSESQAVRTTQGTTLYPFGVQLKLRVDGEPDHVRGWIEAFNARARPLQIM